MTPTGCMVRLALIPKLIGVTMYRHLKAVLNAIFLSCIAILPANADVLFLKGGQRIEGEVTPKGKNYEVLTERGTLTIPKRLVQKLVPDVEVLTEKAKALQTKAPWLFKKRHVGDVRLGAFFPLPGELSNGS